MAVSGSVKTSAGSVKELEDAFRGFVLTRDNMIKLVDVAERLRASLPCILMGEAGCGKTVARLQENAGKPTSSFEGLVGFVETQCSYLVSFLSPGAASTDNKAPGSW